LVYLVGCWLICRPPFGEDCGDMVGERLAGFCRLAFEATMEVWGDIYWFRLGVGFAHAATKNHFAAEVNKKIKLFLFDAAQLRGY
jgi:hypothetical protein